MFLNQLLKVSITLSYDDNDISVKGLLIYIVLISALQQSDSVICVHMLFYIFLHDGESQDMECSPLCCIHPACNSLHRLI